MSSAYTTDEARWQAVRAHDAQADGTFFYAVVTTGIFCRPSCSSRQPRRENVRFFDTLDQARTAGFRDCKRCRPDSLPRDLAIVERARAALDAEPHARMTLAQLSDAVHVSAFHLQRLFTRVMGVSPRQYQAARRGAALRDALQRGERVTRAAVDAGFGSPSRLYENVASELGMTPSVYRDKGAGSTVRFACAPTALGQVLVAATNTGICRIAFGDDAATLVAELRGALAKAELREDTAHIAPFIAQIEAYLDGSRQQFDLPLDIPATAFRQRVWDALRRIPYGETRSYTDIAAALGTPRAVRAVASACASNPVALAIPCHRVVQKGGALAGYRWGLPRKAALLAAESRHSGTASPRTTAGETSGESETRGRGTSRQRDKHAQLDDA
ncbi:bifunctional DNA-binding transcriptional regulator/O6-methylguanine-DNA methyltransferase Ada [Trinickia caryophylli]|uniref:Methylated-DNA--protein-cysteine methyltransferase n=1 Tax=Trinickia caryophylli TaxID=28094 RepID=A0A1X7HAQ5_TRICW|nr:bifunctional DNA-binding transcriptional regulator/O6-methylguanine-DNA methyltransferase Ada [Trinickia caryophylli]PMS08731.1 bifunctional DNA-binding transcriptional regulator/O6-methylguanine-DNA methyltransferase Ada [Trinickia caryophylli]TRX19011.1 bifunctional DNA-binding transcriptional regulator/O6-methylguanine-DNA methyltransferase Ada [Trinickia caryophylli]WQE10190.1 bifunctional DNA-binding transcriptional regulator/O6-methylguanine-DNA methyltransferase Ada [Trinickia caryophy